MNGTEVKALLVDGLNLVRRIYAAVPGSEKGEETDEQSVKAHIDNVIHSSRSSLQRALNYHQPSHCLVVFESGGRNWRHDLFSDYKKDRSAMPKALKQAMIRFESEFETIGVRCFQLPRFEADDIIATLAHKLALHRAQVVILSTDRLHCQLLNDHIRVYDHFSNKDIDNDVIEKKFFVKGPQLPDLLALSGDKSLSIPGVPSIGIRTAAKLINDYHNLEKVLEAADNIPGKLGSKLFSGKSDARVAKQLFMLKTDIDLGINLNQFRYIPE